MAEPLFFCGLGTQKAGTTWLAQYLRGRGDVLTPAVKELHAFDHWYLPRDFAWVPARMAQDLAAATNAARAAELADRVAMAGPADYLGFFRKRLRPQHLAFGEISPSYALLPPEGLAAIRDLTPITRAILLLRDPASRLLSDARWRRGRRAGA